MPIVSIFGPLNITEQKSGPLPNIVSERALSAIPLFFVHRSFMQTLALIA
jgi:hypothetical protein